MAMQSTNFLRCPRREKKGLLHPFEYLQGTSGKYAKADPARCVKEYLRPAAGKQEPESHDLRPLSILCYTTDYLIDQICSDTSYSWASVYEFVFDRFRAIRQDMVIQRICGIGAIQILEKVVRFHIYSEYILCTAPISQFDPHINATHAQECLKRLIVLYKELDGWERNKAELIAIYLLYNLGNTDALLVGLHHKHKLKRYKNFKLAFSMSMCAMNGNYVKLMRLARSLSPIHLCAIHRHLTRIHREAMCKMNIAYSIKNCKYPLLSFCKILNLKDEDEATNVLNRHGLLVTEGHVKFCRLTFKDPEKVPPTQHALVEKELSTSDIGILIQGVLS